MGRETSWREQGDGDETSAGHFQKKGFYELRGHRSLEREMGRVINKVRRFLHERTARI